MVTFNPSKSELAKIDDKIFVSFVEMSSVSNYGYIKTMVDRQMNEIKKGSYTYFAENDIIIAKITPCMENGKCAIATGLTNSIAYGSSEFHVLRCKEGVLNKYIFGYINREKIRQEAAKCMTGSSGHRRVPISFYESLTIPALSIAEQEKIVARADEIQSKINKAEDALKSLNGKISDILNRYLAK